MKRIKSLTLIAAGVLSTIAVPLVSHTQTTYTGTVERVWEDGFRLRSGDRSFKVDTWELYGDNTSEHIQTGDRVTISGEFENGEFDANSLTDAATSTPSTTDTETATPSRVSRAQTTYTGTVERVWEDGFRLRSGDRSFKVDTWELYGDNTAEHIQTGDRVTISGEFENGEFDANSLTDAATSTP
ncbi:MAG: DUF5666 domain-containing protein [Coleofasciculus sp. G3-WIS-01]|uniref:DUF5666 domain-containing protein n=1 Tax=Coleofasciculus sp. G3-WIS-01 TaxID=3069528 RepID=UPI0032F20C5B